MANKIKFQIKPDKISEFIETLEELTRIDDTIKLKIDSDNILMYSILVEIDYFLKNFLALRLSEIPKIPKISFSIMSNPSSIDSTSA